MIQKRFSVCALLLAIFIFGSCTKNSFKSSSYYDEDFSKGTKEKKSGLGFAVADRYDIEIFEGKDMPTFNYEELEKVSIEGEDLNVDEQISPNKERMLKRGNDYDQKKIMMKQLVAKAQELGAAAIIKVNYKVYTSIKATGYSLEGVAVRYKK